MTASTTKKLTAWERWELASFEEEKQSAAMPPTIALPTAAELEEIRRAAHAAGYAEGRAEGLAAGREAGRAEGYAVGHAEGRAAAEAEARRLAELATRLERSLDELSAAVADELLALAVEIARLVVRREVAAHPEHLRQVILEALDRLPQQHAAIHLHPEDAALIKSLLGETLTHGGHRLAEDARLSRGDCLVEAGHTQIDARLSMRWRRVLEQLGLGPLATTDESHEA